MVRYFAIRMAHGKLTVDMVTYARDWTTAYTSIGPADNEKDTIVVLDEETARKCYPDAVAVWEDDRTYFY